MVAQMGYKRCSQKSARREATFPPKPPKPLKPLKPLKIDEEKHAHAQFTMQNDFFELCDYLPV